MMMEKSRKILKSKGGFTLVELLVVIVVLGILSGIGVQQFGNVQERAKQTADLANLRLLNGATQMLAYENDVHPSDLNMVVDLEGAWTDGVVMHEFYISDLEGFLAGLEEDDFGTSDEYDTPTFKATSGVWEY